MTENTILGKPFNLSPEQACLCYKFMREFSRFEFALKQAGYSKQRGEQLIVDWRRFANEHQLVCNSDFTAVDYILHSPPRRQVKLAGTLGWKAMDAPPTPLSLLWLLDAAYVVRNNLFHGGKWTTETEASRDEALICAARGAICLALGVDENVRIHYGDPV